MAFKRVVILGGGPVGLLCAIEARQHFKSVSVVEKRSTYSRTNVPVVDNDLRLHFKTLGVHQKMGLGESAMQGDPPFKRIEGTLFDHASSRGIEMLRPFVVTSVSGGSENKFGRYKSILLTLRQWDDQSRKFVDGAKPLTVNADLLVIATGGGAAADPLVTETLGFTYEKLKAKNYGAYGIFEKTGDVLNPSPGHKEGKLAAREISAKVAAPASIRLQTADYNYLLATLAGITRNDFKLLQSSQERLKKLLFALESARGSGITEKLKEVEKNVGLFKIAIQRARQFYSPKYPAVLVGDAAVTPHPEQGSGYTTGFRGFEELKRLLEALKGTDRSKDNSLIFQGFNDRYELHVSRKALQGTVAIVANNRRTLETYAADIRALAARTKYLGMRQILEHDAATADDLAEELKAQEAAAKKMLAYLEPDKGQELPELGEDETASALWKRIDTTWGQLKKLMKHDALLDDGRLAEVEKKLAIQ